MHMREHYQNAYVTRDLDWAQKRMSEDYGLGGWSRFEVEFPVQTPFGEQLQATKVASAWAGWLQIELIEPVSGYIAPFEAFLPDDPGDPALRFHHFAQRRESMAEVAADIAKTGLGIACQGGIPDLTYTYLDARATLGHFVELVWATPAGWEMIGWPKDRVVR